MTKFGIFSKSIIKENPVLVMMLGLCPSLAVSSNIFSALGMGISTCFVLICSSTAVSLMRKIIPDKVRIPCYIVFISGFVALTQMLVEAFAFPLYQSLGIFLALIAVNCIILARAEIFASKNNVVDSFIDALGAGAGFTLALLAIALFREAFGYGSFFGITIPLIREFRIPILTMAPGGFVAFGVIIAIVNKLSKGTAKNLQKSRCENCAAYSVCEKAGG